MQYGTISVKNDVRAPRSKWKDTPHNEFIRSYKDTNPTYGIGIGLEEHPNQVSYPQGLNSEEFVMTSPSDSNPTPKTILTYKNDAWFIQCT